LLFHRLSFWEERPAFSLLPLLSTALVLSFSPMPFSKANNLLSPELLLLFPFFRSHPKLKVLLGFSPFHHVLENFLFPSFMVLWKNFFSTLLIQNILVLLSVLEGLFSLLVMLGEVQFYRKVPFF